jgi:hypothetical protein
MLYTIVYYVLVPALAAATGVFLGGALAFWNVGKR